MTWQKKSWFPALKKPVEKATVWSQVQRSSDRDWHSTDRGLTDGIDDAAFEDLIALAGDVRRLFHADMTTNEERKELVRSMICRVVVEEQNPGYLVTRIHWCDEREQALVVWRRES